MSKTTLNQSSSDSLCIAMPCSMDWDSMKGTDEVRLCGGCDKNVFNISAMSRKRAEEILSAPQLPCLRIARNTKGRMLYDECPRWLKPLRNSWRKTLGIAVSLLAFFSVGSETKAEEPNQPKTPSTKESKRRATITVTGGVPFRMPGQPVRINQKIWPASISGLGITTEDLPQFNRPRFSADEIAAVDAKKFEMKNVPPQLDQTAWELFYKARKLHLKASMYFVNKQMDKALQDCQESQKSYQLALEQIARGKHDAAFAAFVYQEQNKTTQMELQCRQCLNLPQTK